MIDTVKITVLGTTELYLFKDNCVWLWNTKESTMTMLYTNQDFKSWIAFLLNYQNLGAEIVDGFSDYIIEKSTLEALSK